MGSCTLRKDGSTNCSPCSVWRTFGEAVDMGREVALWLEEYLGEEGFRLFYMSPHHKPRELLADGEWRDLCSEGEVVKHYCT